MANATTDGLFKDYMPDSDDELPTHRGHPRVAGRGWQRQPLIDQVTNGWRMSTEGGDDDDDDDFFYSDKQNWYTPALVTLLAAQRVPRRVQRTMLMLFVFLIAAWVAWTWMIQPFWSEQTKLDEAFSGPQKHGTFGLNAPPAFADVVQVKTLDSSLLPGTSADQNRLVVVGDVHGCKPELVELLHKINFHPASDHLILTGDIIAKGPDSPGVVDLVRDLHASCVRGNHEDRMLLTRKAMKAAEADLVSNKELGEDEARNAGDNKDKKLAKQFDDKQIDWLQQCPVILKVGQIAGMGEVVVVHAGLIPGVDLERQDPFQVMNMRSVDLDTKMPSEDRDGTPWEKLWNYFQKSVPEERRSTIIYGHDSKRGLNIKKYSKGLDSGCVNGGRLTALVIEADHRGGPAKQSLVSVRCSKSSAKKEGKK